MANRNGEDVPGVSRLVAHLDREFRKRDETIASLREELEAERQKFQQETRRTSELVTMLGRAEAQIRYPAESTRRTVLSAIEALLKKPINAPAGGGA